MAHDDPSREEQGEELSDRVFGLVFASAFLVIADWPLRLKLDAGAASYWIARDPPGPPPDSMINQF